MTALNTLLGASDHVVAQVVKAKLRVGAVGDVGLVGRALELERHVVLEQTDGHAQVLIDAAHPLGVALGKVIIDSNDVHALAGNSVEIASQRGDQGLTFAGLHLGDVALVQCHGANKLHVKVAHTHGALGSLTHGGKGLGEHGRRATRRWRNARRNLSVWPRSSSSVIFSNWGSRPLIWSTIL